MTHFGYAQWPVTERSRSECEPKINYKKNHQYFGEIDFFFFKFVTTKYSTNKKRLSIVFSYFIPNWGC
jgi:hypothetical protein